MRKVIVILVACLLTTGCGSLPVGIATINVVRAAGLEQTTAIDIYALHNTVVDSSESTAFDYVQIDRIEDPAEIEGLLAVLDRNVAFVASAECPHQYELRFHLEGGGTEVFAYACNAAGPTFLRGKQAFWQDQQIVPPVEFDQLLQKYLASTPEEDVIGVPDPVKARDAALTYLASVSADQAPAQDLEWQQVDITPTGLVGSSSFRYTSGDWVADVTFPLVAPENTVYEVSIAHEQTGFTWQGQVDATLQVHDIDPAIASVLNTFVEYLGAELGLPLPPAGIQWTVENTTPEGLVGGAAFRLRFEDWQMDITYPVVAPEYVTYQVLLSNEKTGFQWEGQVDAKGQLMINQDEVSLPDMTAQANGNNQFALELYQLLKEQDGNLVFSPYSISAALAMTYAGARGTTEQQMADALHFLPDQAQVHAAFSALNAVLASRGQGGEGQEGKGFQLHIANALWGQKGMQFLVDFLSVVEQFYDTGFQEMDFVADPDAARIEINNWIASQTEDRIQDLLKPGIITKMTSLVLTNAIYFDGAWAQEFDATATSDGAFSLLDGSEVTVPMMVKNEQIAYTSREDFQAVELPYVGNQLSMVLLVPNSGSFEAFEDSLNAPELDAIVAEMGLQQITLALPKFEFASEFGLNKGLSALGMVTPFTEEADFSGMTDQHGLFISDVVHKAFVSVDEAGTEAAAATAVIIAKSSMPQETLQVTVDRPFLFVIRDRETGTVLFVGRVLDPSS